MKRSVFLLLAFLGLFFSSSFFNRVWARSYQVSGEGEISKVYSFDAEQPLYRLAVSADITFGRASSYVRVILIDQNQNEYLVYEAFPLITKTGSFSVEDRCEETCLLDAVVPHSIRVEGADSGIEITQLSAVNNLQQLAILTRARVFAFGIEGERERIIQQKSAAKIQALNRGIERAGMDWVAGETSVSGLSYAEKKRLFPGNKLPNLQGFEFYKGGVFEFRSEDAAAFEGGQVTSAGLPEAWDWRDRHGENWLTSVKDQGLWGQGGGK